MNELAWLVRAETRRALPAVLTSDTELRLCTDCAVAAEALGVEAFVVRDFFVELDIPLYNEDISRNLEKKTTISLLSFSSRCYL